MYFGGAMKNKKVSSEWFRLGLLFGVTFGIIFHKLALGIILGGLIGLTIDRLNKSKKE